MRAWGTALALSAIATLLGAAPGAGGPDGTLGRCRAVDGVAAVPSGIVPLGEDGNGTPGEQVAVPAFRIDRHEVTNAQFAAFVRATSYRTQAEREGAAPVFVMPRMPVSLDDPRSWWRMTKGADWRHPRGATTTLAGHLDEPVVQVSFEDAQAYARWAGGALPTVAQWERAARGGQAGPRGSDSWRRDSTGRATANSWQGVFPLVDTGTDGHAGLAPVGCYEANDWGLVDMVGNAWEWTLDEAGPGRRVLKGGSFLCAENYCANYRPAAWQAQDHDLGASHIGFRVVYAAGPRRRPTA